MYPHRDNADPTNFEPGSPDEEAEGDAAWYDALRAQDEPGSPDEEPVAEFPRFAGDAEPVCALCGDGQSDPHNGHIFSTDPNAWRELYRPDADAVFAALSPAFSDKNRHDRVMNLTETESSIPARETVRPKVSFRKWYDPKRVREGEVLRELGNGSLLVRTMHRAARGGEWSSTDIVVKPHEVVQKEAKNG
jgi:hypothetical protein